MNKWIEYYLDRGDISAECARAWERAQEAYYEALKLRDPWVYFPALHEAEKYHPHGGDCTSDNIECEYFPYYLDEGQIKSLAERNPNSDWPTIYKMQQIFRWGKLKE